MWLLCWFPERADFIQKDQNMTNVFSVIAFTVNWRTWAAASKAFCVDVTPDTLWGRHQAPSPEDKATQVSTRHPF